jgi:5-amino-6-(5-phosphoribosylamino)uracil reductase
VTERPYVLLSVAMSVDGCIDDGTDSRLILSNDADLDRVDEVRAGCDAILVGAGTIRRDNPALLVRSQARRTRRVARGLPPSPARVTITASGDLDPASRFFTAGDGARLVYVPAAEQGRVRGCLAGAAGAEVVGAGDPPGPPGAPPCRVSLAAVLADLAARGVRRLMVEGGGAVLAQFLAEGLADELDLVMAPVFVGDPAAPRIGGTAAPAPLHRMHLAETRLIGDVVLLRYLPGLAARGRAAAGGGSFRDLWAYHVN